VSMQTPANVPLLSVVVPTHDVATWLTECLDTIARQDVDLEVIVVDDHSTDDTLALARRRAEADPRFRVLEATGRGGAAARNQGVEQARGRYLIFADGDDIVPRGAYAALVGALEASGDDLAVGDFLKFNARTTWRPSKGFDAFSEHRSSVAIDDVPSLIRFRACWHKAFRLEKWRADGLLFPSVPRSNDIVPMTSALLGAASISVVTDVVYTYRDRPGHGSMTKKAGQLAGTLSYFSEEARCTELVVRDGREAVVQEYFSMVLVNDGWVHLRKLMAQGRIPISPAEREELASVVTTLLSEAPTDVVERLGPNQNRIYRVVGAGRVDLVWSLPGVPGTTDVVPDDPADILAAVSRAGELVTLLGGLGDPEAGETVVERIVMPHLLALSLSDDDDAKAEASRLSAVFPATSLNTSTAGVVGLAAGSAWARLARLADLVRDLRVDVDDFDGRRAMLSSSGQSPDVPVSLLLQHASGHSVEWTELPPSNTATAALPRRVRTTPGVWSVRAQVDLEGTHVELPARVSRFALQRPADPLASVVVAQADDADSELQFITRSRLVRRLAGAALRRARATAGRIRR